MSFANTSRLGVALALAIVLAYAWRWGSLAAFWIALDPISALGACLGADGRTQPFCDFVYHYYPQGQLVRASAALVPGYFYPAPFALLMGAFTLLGDRLALIVWVAVVAASLATLYLWPQRQLFARTPAGAIHPLLFLTSLPVLHTFIWGQASALAAMLVLGTFLAYDRGRTRTAAGLLAAAIAMKLYPAAFAPYFLAKRDRRALVACVVYTVLLIAIVPAVVMRPRDALSFNVDLVRAIAHYARTVAGSPYPNYIATAFGASSGSWAFAVWQVIGVCVWISSAFIALKLIRARVPAEPYWIATFAFLSLPFIVTTTWEHYFAFLPFVQSFLLVILAGGSFARPVKMALAAALLVPSIVPSNLFPFRTFETPASASDIG